MSGEIRYYRGLHKVRVVTQSVGYWIVEALEDFEDFVDEKRTLVKTGEQRIVPPSVVFKEKTLSPIVKEHVYELQMEKKLRTLIEKGEKAKTKKTK